MPVDSNKGASDGLHKGRLKRLNDSYYFGRSYVHWTMSLKHRANGWLNLSHHNALRAVLFHSLARGQLCCPVYCLMPDHAHFIFIGLRDTSDQKQAVRYLRKQWNNLLRPHELERQAFDNVLREADRARDAFADVCGYVLRNPVRAQHCDQWQNWPYSGSVFPGYPKLDLRNEHFWENFWKAYAEQST